MGSALIRGWAISNFSFTHDRRLFEVGLFRAFLQGWGGRLSLLFPFIARVAGGISSASKGLAKDL